jgi:hypothetical protein
MQGSGLSKGSVAEGGIYRESREITIPAPAQDGAAK